MKIFLTIFITVFIAELGDKTQLSTMLFASDKKVSPWLVFAASGMALLCATGMGVLGGQLLGEWLNPRYLQVISGVGFVAIGIFLLFKGP